MRSIQPCFFFCGFAATGFGGSPKCSETNLILGRSGGSGHTSLLVSILLRSIPSFFAGAADSSFFFLSFLPAWLAGTSNNASATTRNQVIQVRNCGLELIVIA